MTLNHILRKCTAGHKITRIDKPVNVHGRHQTVCQKQNKKKKELEPLIQTVRIYNQVIGNAGIVWEIKI